MKSVEKIASNADGKPVQSTTRTKISQTWFASHTGPIAQSISSRGRRPPLAAAGEQAPEARPEVGASEDRVHRHADDEHDRDGVRERSPRALRGDRRRAGVGAVRHLVVLARLRLRQRRDIARSVMISVAPSAT